MSKREITVLTDVSLITCIVQRGIADTIVKAAQEAGAQGATVYYARGEGVRERLGILALAVEVDKEVINVVVAKDQADRILERMYIAGNLDTPGMGLIFLTPLAYRGVGEQTEKELLTVTVPGKDADEIFEFIYDEAKIDRPHGGLIYMSRLDRVSAYSLPEDLPEEE